MERNDLVFVVNGDEVRPTYVDGTTLRAVAERALLASKYSDRPFNEWEVRFENGISIRDLDQQIAAYVFKPGTHLYMTLAVGALG